MSGYLGSIGFGFPAAMGAWAAAPDRPIVAVTGDGGFGQYLAELTTAVKYGMNITHVLLNNSLARQDHQGAARRRVRRVADRPAQPRLRRVRRALRRHGIRVEQQTNSTTRSRPPSPPDGPALVEVITDPELV